jgi:hypothetical protein
MPLSMYKNALRGQGTKGLHQSFILFIWKRRIPYHVIGLLANTYRFLSVDWSQAGHLHHFLTPRHLDGNFDSRWIRHLTDREALPFSLGLGPSLLLSTLLQFILPVLVYFHFRAGVMITDATLILQISQEVSDLFWCIDCFLNCFFI